MTLMLEMAQPSLFARPVLEAPDSLEVLMLGILASPQAHPCPVCGAVLRPITKGLVECSGCGSEIEREEDAPGRAWVA